TVNHVTPLDETPLWVRTLDQSVEQRPVGICKIVMVVAVDDRLTNEAYRRGQQTDKTIRKLQRAFSSLKYVWLLLSKQTAHVVEQTFCHRCDSTDCIGSRSSGIASHFVERIRHGRCDIADYVTNSFRR